MNGVRGPFVVYVGAEGLEGASKDLETTHKTAIGREPPPVEATKRDDSRRPIDPLEAVRVALKLAVDAGQYELAAKLLDVLKSAPAPAKVVDLVRSR